MVNAKELSRVSLWGTQVVSTHAHTALGWGGCGCGSRRHELKRNVGRLAGQPGSHAGEGWREEINRLLAPYRLQKAKDLGVVAG